ncbi:MAG TPA: hypothetical protein DD435_02600 [Cyanobacteria bacterium UBA8530]|nr:hypothetical protein [Cyanobacteria bacterium UBA8530]
MIDGNSGINRNTTRPLTARTTPLYGDDKKEGIGSKISGFAGDVFVGGGEAILDMGKGLVNTIFHPLQTIKGLAFVVTHPAALLNAFVDPYKTAIKEGHPGKALGRGIVEIGSLFVGPTEVSNAAKGVFKFFKGGGKTSTVVNAGAAASAKGLDYSSRCIRGIPKVQAKLNALNAAGKTAEAAQMSQLLQSMTKAASIAAAGDGAKAIQLVQAAAKAPGMRSTLKLANSLAGTGAGAAAVTAGRTGVAAQNATLATKGMLTLKAATTLGRMSVLPAFSDLQNFNPEMASQLAESYHLDPDFENVKAFLEEVSKYRDGVIGPDTGKPEQVIQLQSILRAVGYLLEETGKFDDATALAVIDFKRKNGIHQAYRLENGQAAINEYVDEKTAEALYKMVNLTPSLSE